ncbi:MAG: DUF4355 domain-containing protein [Clostridia bacterium]|nr:DUF4355 domain-containing protein [Clostridia bacterium]
MENDKKNMETTAESVEKEVETTKVEEKTFTRDEVNKMINAEKQKEREAIIREYESKKQEAEKLAKMDEDQKKNYEIEQARQRASKAERELEAYKLKDETIRQANSKGIALELINTIEFERETAESINKKLEIFEKITKTEREKAIIEYSKEPSPKTGDKVDTTPKSGYEKFISNSGI